MKAQTLALRRALSLHWSLVCIGLKADPLVERFKVAIDAHDFATLYALSTDVTRLASTSGRLCDPRSCELRSKFLHSVRAVRPASAEAVMP